MTVAVLMIDLVLVLRAGDVAGRGHPHRRAHPAAPDHHDLAHHHVALIPVAFFPRTGIDAYAPLAVVSWGV